MNRLICKTPGPSIGGMRGIQGVKKLDIDQAVELARLANIDLDAEADEHDLAWADVSYILDLAKASGYKKPKGASASKGVYFFRKLKRHYNKYPKRFS